MQLFVELMRESALEVGGGIVARWRRRRRRREEARLLTLAGGLHVLQSTDFLLAVG